MHATATELLAGHEIDRLFARLSTIDARDHASLRALAHELAAHTRIEERTLYPIARSARSAEDAPGRSVAALVLARMDSGFDPKLAALADLVQDEIDRDVLAGEVDAPDVERVGDELARRFDDLLIATAIVTTRARSSRARHDGLRQAARRRPSRDAR